jgi:hypothetical protein
LVFSAALALLSTFAHPREAEARGGFVFAELDEDAGWR